MAERKCPNCGAEMQSAAGGAQLVCPYCDTVLNIVKPAPQTTEQETEQKFYPAKELFNIQCSKFSKQIFLDVYGEMCSYINGLDNTVEGYSADNTIEKYLIGLNKDAAKSVNIATHSTNAANMRAAEIKISQGYESGEKSLVFIDYGIFSKGKTGIMITNKAVYRVKKRGASKISLKDVHSLYAWRSTTIDSSEWLLNGDYDFGIYSWDGPMHLAKFLAVICTLARDCHADGYKIIIDEK